MLSLCEKFRIMGIIGSGLKVPIASADGLEAMLLPLYRDDSEEEDSQ
jgi:hypothetical protein